MYKEGYGLAVTVRLRYLKQIQEALTPFKMKTIKLQLLAVFIALIAFSTPSLGLFEDQAGKNDWHRSLIGVPQSVVHDGHNIFIFTENGILANVYARSGDLLWRQEIRKRGDMTEKCELLLNENVLYSMCKNSPELSAWKVSNGALLWSKELDEDFEKASIISHKRNIYIIMANAIVTVSLIDGSLRKLRTDDGIVLVNGVLNPQSRALHVVGHNTGSSSLFVGTMRLDSGMFTSKKSVIMSECKLSEAIITQSSEVLGICSNTVKPMFTWNNVHGIKYITSDLVGPKHNIHQIALKGQESEFLLIHNDCHAVVARFSKDSLTILHKFAAFQEFDVFSAKLVGAESAGIVGLSIEDSGIAAEIVTVDLTKGDISVKEYNELKIDTVNVQRTNILTAPMKTKTLTKVEHGAASNVFLGGIKASSKSSKWIPRLSIVSESGVFAHIIPIDDREYKIRWAREESLASAILGKLIELPADEIIHEQTIIDNVSNFFSAVLGVVQKPEESLNTRGVFGFNQALVLATSRGTVCGIHSTGGRVLWCKYLDGAIITQIEAVRLPEPHKNDKMVVGGWKLQALVVMENRIESLDPVTGETLLRLDLPKDIITRVVLLHEGGLHYGPLLVFDQSERVYLFPNTADSWHTFSQKAPLMRIFDVSKTMGKVTGNEVVIRVDGVVSEDVFVHAANLVESWSIKLREGEDIVDWFARDSLEKVSSPVRVLSDRTLIQKYMNPNTLSISTLKAPSVLNVYLIDTITGSILTQHEHTNAHSPIHSILTDNWVFYHFRSPHFHGHELVSIELVDVSPHFGNTTHINSVYSSPPATASQGYIIPTGIKCIGVTRTSYGISPRSILLGLESGQLLSLPLKSLDPRRPLPGSEKPTAETEVRPLEEYSPIVNVDPKKILSYNIQILGLRAISVASTKLESTSLVCAWGVDLFCTLASPSGTFDKLNEDFNFPLLAISLIALILLTPLMKFLAGRKEGLDRWK